MSLRALIICLILTQLGNAQVEIGIIPLPDSVTYSASFIDRENFLLSTSISTYGEEVRNQQLHQYKYINDEWQKATDFSLFHDGTNRSIAGIKCSQNAEFIAFELSRNDLVDELGQAVVVRKMTKSTGLYEEIFRLDSIAFRRTESLDVDLSRDGKTLVVSHISKNFLQNFGPIRMRVYHYSDSIGAYLKNFDYITPHSDGVSTWQSSVSLSGDGKTITLGFFVTDWAVDPEAAYDGLLFNFSEDQRTWKEGALYTEIDSNRKILPRYTALSYNGKKVVFSSQIYNNQQRTNALLYELEQDKWEANDQRFLSNTEGTFGILEDGMSLSDDGTLLAISHVNESTNPISHVDLYKNDGEWKKVHEFSYPTLTGTGMRTGNTCKLSPDGTRLLLEDAQRNLRIYDLTEFTSATTEPDQLSVSIYPNPGSGQLYLSYDKQERLSRITVFNLHGQHMKTIESNHDSFTLHDLNAGLYIVKLHFESGVVTKTILKY